MAKMLSAAENAANFQPTVLDDSVLGKKWLLKELMRSEYLCVEYPHVALKFLPGGVLQVFGEQKQPIIHRYSIAHKPDGQWALTVSPSLTNEPGEMLMKAVQNHLTLLPAVEGQGETLHLNKLNFRTLQDNSK